MNFPVRNLHKLHILVVQADVYHQSSVSWPASLLHVTKIIMHFIPFTSVCHVHLSIPSPHIPPQKSLNRLESDLVRPWYPTALILSQNTQLPAWIFITPCLAASILAFVFLLFWLPTYFLQT